MTCLFTTIVFVCSFLKNKLIFYFICSRLLLFLNLNSYYYGKNHTSHFCISGNNLRTAKHQFSTKYLQIEFAVLELIENILPKYWMFSPCACEASSRNFPFNRKHQTGHFYLLKVMLYEPVIFILKQLNYKIYFDVGIPDRNII